MLKWTIAIFGIIISANLHAEDWRCAFDSDGSGSVDREEETAACIYSQAAGYTCPINAAAQCVNMDAAPPTDTTEVPDGMLIDDGDRNSQGHCIAQIYIFSGRGQQCRESGVKTAFKNCCKNQGEVFSDSVGSMSSAFGAAGNIKKVYDVASVAVYNYKSALELTGNTAQAAQAGTEAAKSQMAVAFDPTTLAISVAMYFIMDYLMKGCDQESMETAMMAASGYCHLVGDFCSEEWDWAGCVQEEQSYCCFNSKMARIVHEQGRSQLLSFNGWGSPTNPQCRGFTPEEFQSLDFSKIDMSEYYEDIAANVKSEMQGEIQDSVDEYMDQVGP